MVFYLSFMKENNQPYILRILKQFDGWEYRPKDMIYALESAISNEVAGNLTLEQYKEMRSLVESNYKYYVRLGLKRGVLKQEDVDKVGRLFTDYIREQHYSLLDSEKERKVVVADEKPASFAQKVGGYFRRIKNNFEYKNNWKEKDKEIYVLERLLYGGKENPSLEKELINNLPTNGLSRQKIKTLERMMPRTHFKRTLSNIIRNYSAKNQQEDYFYYAEGLKRTA